MNRASKYQDVWVFVACWVGAMAAGIRGPVTDLVAAALGVDSGDDSPLGYLRKDVVSGVCAAVALLVVCIFVASVWKRSSLWTMTGAFVAWSILMSRIIFAFEVVWRCLDRVSPAQANALFEDAALRTSSYTTGTLSGVVIVLTLSLATRLNSKRPVDEDHGQAVSEV